MANAVRRLTATFWSSVGGRFRSELAQVVQAAMSLTPMLLQSQIKPDHLDEALYVGVYFRYPLPEDAYATTAVDQITGEVYGINRSP